MDGKNIADFVDKDILQRLDELEMEEDMLEKAQADEMIDDERDLDEDSARAYKDIVSKRAKLRLKHKLSLSKRAYVHKIDLEEAKEELEN